MGLSVTRRPIVWLVKAIGFCVENNRIVENTNEARAAVTGYNVLLLTSTLAAIVLFAVAYVVTRS